MTNRIISFGYNWNNKLDCHAFTTIRLFQPTKYCIGETYDITLNKQKICEAIVIDIKLFWLKDISPFIAYLDTGYSKEECTDIINKMYPFVDFNSTYLSLILIKKK